jgi:hypothetical protein
MYMKEFENLILNCFFKVEYCHLYKYTMICVQYLSGLSELSTLCKFHIFGSVHAMKTTILPLESVKQNLLIPNDTVLVKCSQIYHQAIYDLCLWEVKRYHFHYIFYRIWPLCTYHFRNIGTRILNTIYRVLFSSLCLQIFIFYFGIYRIKSIFIFLARHQAIKTKHSKGQSTPSGSGLHVHLACVAGGIRGHERTGRLK